jgi:hypothetical protein
MRSPNVAPRERGCGWCPPGRGRTECHAAPYWASRPPWLPSRRAPTLGL